MEHNRRQLCQALAACVLLQVSPVGAQEGTYPDRPIRLVVPYPPGGFTDMLARLIAEKLGPRLGQSVLVDNRGGGAGTIGTSYVVKSPADGYTLLIVANDLSINETLLADRISYKALEDLAPIAQVAWSPIVLAVHPSFPAKTVADVIAMAKAKPGKIMFGSGGIGTGGHLSLEMLKARAHINLGHVPYRGNGPALNDLLGGQISAMFIQYAVIRPHVASGALRVLATPSSKRLAVLPDVPTIAESGLPGFSVEPWFGVVAPAGTPTAIVNRLNAQLREVMREPDIVKRLGDLGAEAMATSPQAFTDMIRSQISSWGQLIRDAHIRLE